LCPAGMPKLPPPPKPFPVTTTEPVRVDPAAPVFLITRSRLSAAPGAAVNWSSGFAGETSIFAAGPAGRRRERTARRLGAGWPGGAQVAVRNTIVFAVTLFVAMVTLPLAFWLPAGRVRFAGLGTDPASLLLKVIAAPRFGAGAESETLPFSEAPLGTVTTVAPPLACPGGDAVNDRSGAKPRAGPVRRPKSWVIRTTSAGPLEHTTPIPI